MQIITSKTDLSVIWRERCFSWRTSGTVSISCKLQKWMTSSGVPREIRLFSPIPLRNTTDSLGMFINHVDTLQGFFCTYFDQFWPFLGHFLPTLTFWLFVDKFLIIFSKSLLINFDHYWQFFYLFQSFLNHFLLSTWFMNAPFQRFHFVEGLL